VIDIAHDAIALMCEGLHLLGDRHAIFGFSGQGRLQVDLRVAKGFDQPWSAQTAAALASLEPEGSTRTGAAIRYAVSQLLPQPAQTRVLMLVTDGYPQDRDYGPDRNDRAYGLHDTAQALREAARAGIAAFCITVDQAAHDYLRGVCPAHRYLVIDDVNSLPERLSRLYRRLTSA
jgi:nitric oxide reductase NorD protein